jgi:hypothetical protein
MTRSTSTYHVGYAGGLCNKHKVGNTGMTRVPYEYLYDTLGLVKLSPRRA